MRIAYIAPYQGPLLLQRRPIVANLALAANLKIELIAELLESKQHEVEILSQGESGERHFKLYPAFQEAPLSQSNVSVHYGSALPIRFLNGVWSIWQMLRLLRDRHREAPFDLVIIYNFKDPQALAALHAIRRLRLPVILEYEDDGLVEVDGRSERGWRPALNRRLVGHVLNSIRGCIGVSPHLLSQAPSGVPKVLLRGVVSPDILRMSDDPPIQRHQYVVFSGTHFRSKGLPQLIAAWKLAQPPGWQLHIAGHGELTAQLQESAAGDDTIVFHGLVDRQQNARLLRQSAIGINPHELSHTPGNVFAFKIIEYLAAGAHVITTPMGVLEPELEAGVTYIPDNRPETIATNLLQVINGRQFERNATGAARRLYSPTAVSAALDTLVKEVVSRSGGSAAPDFTNVGHPVNSGDPNK
jgi:glycosyltransferase involved in cell wall biosynthesis